MKSTIILCVTFCCFDIDYLLKSCYNYFDGDVIMTVSDWINLSLSILSFILAVISVVTVVITLRQNHKMIEESNRPYITVYGDKTNFSSPQFYLVIKNFGKTGAFIESLECDIDLGKYSYQTGITPFQNIVGTLIAPNQNFICNIDYMQLSEDNIDVINFAIKYTANGKSYCEKYPVNYSAVKKNITIKSATKDKELRTISYALQEMVQKDL